MNNIMKISTTLLGFMALVLITCTGYLGYQSISNQASVSVALTTKGPTAVTIKDLPATQDSRNPNYGKQHPYLISWSSVSGATTYKVIIQPDNRTPGADDCAVGSGDVCGSPVTPNSTTYTWSHFILGTTYNIKVVAIGPFGTSLPSDPVIKSIPAYQDLVSKYNFSGSISGPKLSPLPNTDKKTGIAYLGCGSTTLNVSWDYINSSNVVNPYKGYGFATHLSATTYTWDQNCTAPGDICQTYPVSPGLSTPIFIDESKVNYPITGLAPGNYSLSVFGLNKQGKGVLPTTVKFNIPTNGQCGVVVATSTTGTTLADAQALVASMEADHPYDELLPLSNGTVILDHTFVGPSGGNNGQGHQFVSFNSTSIHASGYTVDLANPYTEIRDGVGLYQGCTTAGTYTLNTNFANGQSEIFGPFDDAVTVKMTGQVAGIFTIDGKVIAESPVSDTAPINYTIKIPKGGKLGKIGVSGLDNNYNCSGNLSLGVEIDNTWLRDGLRSLIGKVSSASSEDTFMIGSFDNGVKRIYTTSMCNANSCNINWDNFKLDLNKNAGKYYLLIAQAHDHPKYPDLDMKNKLFPLWPTVIGVPPSVGFDTLVGDYGVVKYLSDTYKPRTISAYLVDLASPTTGNLWSYGEVPTVDALAKGYAAFKVMRDNNTAFIPVDGGYSFNSVYYLKKVILDSGLPIKLIKASDFDQLGS